MILDKQLPLSKEQDSMYPIIEQVENASRYQVCEWYRFLPSPCSDNEVKVMDKIVERFKKLGGFTPEISKSLGDN